MLMVFVQPSVFTRREHRDNDEAGVDVAECQGVECQERTKLCLAVGAHQDHVLRTDAILARAIHGRFVTHHHARFQGHGVLLHANALRSLMHVEAMSYAMSRAVQVVDASIPQGFAG